MVVDKVDSSSFFVLILYFLWFPSFQIESSKWWQMFTTIGSLFLTCWGSFLRSFSGNGNFVVADARRRQNCCCDSVGAYTGKGFVTFFFPEQPHTWKMSYLFFLRLDIDAGSSLLLSSLFCLIDYVAFHFMRFVHQNVVTWHHLLAVSLCLCVAIDSRAVTRQSLRSDDE